MKGWDEGVGSGLRFSFPCWDHCLSTAAVRAAALCTSHARTPTLLLLFPVTENVTQLVNEAPCAAVLSSSTAPRSVKELSTVSKQLTENDSLRTYSTSQTDYSGMRRFPEEKAGPLPSPLGYNGCSRGVSAQ